MPAPEPEPENFVQILERVWWRLDRALDADSLRASARLYLAESLLAGTTAVVDHHESPGFIEGSLSALGDACTELGIRALLCYGATERNGGQDEANRGLEECRRFIESAPSSLVGAVALHASFTVSDETIRAAGQLCRDTGAVMHVHLAEDGADVVDARTRGYPGPLERLIALEALPPGSVMAHGVHLSAAQTREGEARGCWLVHNPRSNDGNGVGYAVNLRHNARVALGTDGYPARMKDELTALMKHSKAHGEEPLTVAPRLGRGRELFSELAGLDLGALTVGATADLVVEDAEGPLHVLVGGRVVVRDRKLVTGDIESIRSDADEAAKGLWARMRAL
jgi:cytosine/adenosine deaminase-related metal-dependent hydrolase